MMGDDAGSCIASLPVVIGTNDNLHANHDDICDLN
jgi:hypothetical protein